METDKFTEKVPLTHLTRRYLMTHMRKVTLFLTLALVTMLVAGCLCFGAEKYPTKPIQVIVPFTAGGSSDLTARTVEKFWTKYSPQPMVIVNKPGAGGVLGEEFVVRSKPDGYTIYILSLIHI